VTKVSILPVATDDGSVSYQAVAGERQSRGNTAGEALDALTAQLPEDEAGTLIIVQSRRPDRFFTATRQQRLAELMGRWRAARDQGEALPADEQAELDALVGAELGGSASRAAALADELGR
jgi:hypothetical protein